MKRNFKTEEKIIVGIKSYRYEKACEKKQLKKEAKQRDLVRKQKMGWVF